MINLNILPLVDDIKKTLGTALSREGPWAIATGMLSDLKDNKKVAADIREMAETGIRIDKDRPVHVFRNAQQEIRAALVQYDAGYGLHKAEHGPRFDITNEELHVQNPKGIGGIPFKNFGWQNIEVHAQGEPIHLNLKERTAGQLGITVFDGPADIVFGNETTGVELSLRGFHSGKHETTITIPAQLAVKIADNVMLADDVPPTGRASLKFGEDNGMHKQCPPNKINMSPPVGVDFNNYNVTAIVTSEHGISRRIPLYKNGFPNENMGTALRGAAMEIIRETEKKNQAAQGATR